MSNELKGKIVRVPEWIMKKNLGYSAGYELRYFEVIKETEKAVLVYVSEMQDMWCPKSQIEDVIEPEEKPEVDAAAKELEEAINGNAKAERKETPEETIARLDREAAEFFGDAESDSGCINVHDAEKADTRKLIEEPEQAQRKIVIELSDNAAETFRYNEKTKIYEGSGQGFTYEQFREYAARLNYDLGLYETARIWEYDEFRGWERTSWKFFDFA